MNRLTANKNVSEMGMFELAHNSCYTKDGNATYRDYEKEIDARDFIRKTAVKFNIFEDGCAELIDDESFDETMIDYLQYGYDTKEGLLALFYRNLWAQADLYEELKQYEDLEEECKLLKLTCLPGDYVWEVNVKRGIISEYEVTSIRYGINKSLRYMWTLREGICGGLDGFLEEQIDKTVFLTKDQAEAALQKINEEKGEVT